MARSAVIIALSLTVACASRGSGRSGASPVAVRPDTTVPKSSDANRAASPSAPDANNTPPSPDNDSAEAPPTGLQPLSDAHRAVLFGSPQDKVPETFGGATPALVGKQYLAGNEKTPHAFYKAVKDIGGGYVGVGSDQGYLFVGWARPEIAWFIDYDPAVQQIHEVYRLFFLAAETPEEMLTYWHLDGRDKAKELLAKHHQGRDGRYLRRLYLHHRGWINRRLRSLAKRLQTDGVPSYLTDQDDYDYVRQMLTHERVRPMLVNLVKRGGMLGVADAATKLDVPIRLLYLSNAEEYWSRYTNQFRANIAALPVDDKSIVLRTLLIWKVNQDYRYNVQPMSNYRDWLAQPFRLNVYNMTSKKPKADPDIINFFETNTDPADTSFARKAAREAKTAPTRARGNKS